MNNLDIELTWNDLELIIIYNVIWACKVSWSQENQNLKGVKVCWNKQITRWVHFICFVRNPPSKISWTSRFLGLLDFPSGTLIAPSCLCAPHPMAIPTLGTWKRS